MVKQLLVYRYVSYLLNWVHKSYWWTPCFHGHIQWQKLALCRCTSQSCISLDIAKGKHVIKS